VLDSVLDLTLARNADLLKRGAVLVDERDTGTRPRVLFYLEHAMQDAGLTHHGDRRVVSKRMDHRAAQLQAQEQAGKPNARLNSGEAHKRAGLLQARPQKRLEELKLEAQISPLSPVVLGGVLVVPMGLLTLMSGRASMAPSVPIDTQASARARAIIMEIERRLGFAPTDREFEKLGYDIESRVPGTGKLRFIEV
jgi:hypothetical protein